VTSFQVKILENRARKSDQFSGKKKLENRTRKSDQFSGKNIGK
jgi:hypothetical protein